MRNFKKVTALVLAFAMVLSTFTVSFAAETQTDAQICETLGMLQGTGDGVSEDYLASTPARYQAAILFLRLKGLEAEASAFTGTENFSDVDGLNAKNKAILAYLKANPELGWVGNPDGSFAPLEAITAQAYVKVLLEALGYEAGTDFEWSTVFTVAQEKGLVAYTENPESFKVSDIATATVEALKANNKDGVKLVDALVAAGTVDAAKAETVGLYTPPVTTLAVESVSAPNLGQIKVAFNKAVDKTSAEAAANYTLVAKNGGTAVLAGATFTLAADAKSVLIDLATKSDNQKDYTLTVKDVKDTSGAKLSETSKDFLAVDMTLPTVEKVEVTGTKTLKVTMSEPVDTTGAQTIASFKIDNGTVSAPTFAVGTTTSRNIITLTLAAELSEGAHTITIKDVKDLAGFLSVSEDVTVSYAKDTSAPTVSIKEVKSDAKTVVLKFSKDIDMTNLASNNVLFSHTYNGSNQVAGGTAGVVTKVSDSEYNILFAAAIPPGTTSIFIKYADGVTDASKVKDLFGNILTLPVTLQATVTADLTAPTVTGVSQKDADEIYVDFSEDVNLADAQITGNYRLVNSKNETIALTSATYVAADKRTTLRATSNLTAGDYSLEVKNIYDKAVVPNKMVTVTNSITIVDKVAPTISLAAYNTTTKKLTIKFSKDMVGTGLTDLSNYALTVDGSAKSFPTGTSVAVKDSKTIEITMGSTVTGLDGTTDSIQVSGSFTSSAGIAIGGISVTQPVVASSTVAPAYVADSAKFVDKETITFELDTELTSIDPTKIDFDGVAVASASYVNQGNKSVVTLKVAAGQVLAATNAATWAAQDVAYNAANAVVSTFGGGNTGIATVVAGSAIKDKAAPYIKSSVTDDTDSDGQIDQLVVTLSESVVAGSVATTDFTLSDGYSINSVVSVNGAVVTLKLNESGLPDTGVTPSIAIAGSIEDLVGNVTTTGTSVASTDGAAPVMISASATAAKDIAIVYSENITVANTAPTQWVLDVDGAGATVVDTTSANTAVVGNATNVITITITTATFVTGTADNDATITYTAGAAVVSDGTNNAVTPQTITGIASGF